MKIGYQVNYIAFVLSLLLCVVSAMQHQLGWVIFNFIGAVWNWYVAEYKRGLENEKNNNHKSDDSDSTSDNSEDEE